MTSPYRIITVCTGNICRSPMAELMLRHAADAAGIPVVLDSAGTSGWEIGNPIDPRAASQLDGAGIGSEEHVARRFDSSWYADRDLILALDVDHYEDLLADAPNAAARAKIRMLRSFDPAVQDLEPGEQGIADPWYGDAGDFDNSGRLIAAAIPGILAFAQQQLAERSGDAQL
jgi:protein-tyrosine phosphatase